MSGPPVPPKRTSSGNHPAVVGARKKMDSIAENTLPRMDEAVEALDRVLTSSAPPTGTDRQETPIPQLSGPPDLPPAVAGSEEEEALPSTERVPAVEAPPDSKRATRKFSAFIPAVEKKKPPS